MEIQSFEEYVAWIQSQEERCLITEAAAATLMSNKPIQEVKPDHDTVVQGMVFLSDEDVTFLG